MAMFGHFSLKQLNAMPTLSQGQADDLKYDDGVTRVWLSRITVSDGAEYNNQVTVERYIKNSWQPIETYQANAWSDFEDDHPYVKDLQID